MPHLHRRVLLSSVRGLNSTTVTARRSYVGLAYHEAAQKQPQHASTAATVQTVDRNLKSFQQAAVSTSASSGITSVGSHGVATNEAVPVFEVVSSGVGSALLVKMPAETEITTAAGAAIGSSSKVSSKLSFDTSLVKAVGRKFVGDPIFYQKFYTKQTPGDVLVAPQRIGEIATVDIRGSSKYALRRDAFLAKTGKVSLEIGLQGVKGKNAGLSNKLVHTVSGPGTVAISHYGGLYRLSLGAGEEYLVNPRNLIMWDIRTNPSKLHPANPEVPSPRSPLRRFTFVRHVVDSPSLQPKLQYIDSLVKSARNYLLGAPDFVKLKGPGDVFLSSRVEPHFEKTRLMNALGAMNGSLESAVEHSSLFPPGAAETFQPAYQQAATKKKQPAVLAYGTSKNGKPTYYAEVGPRGQVTFISEEKKE